MTKEKRRKQRAVTVAPAESLVAPYEIRDGTDTHLVQDDHSFVLETSLSLTSGEDRLISAMQKPYGYILGEDRIPRPSYDMIELAMSLDADRKVAFTQKDGYYVSTVFIGIIPSFLAGRAPLVFETMIFTNDESITVDRYATFAEAELGHQKAVEAAELAFAKRAKEVDSAKSIEGPTGEGDELQG